MVFFSKLSQTVAEETFIFVCESFGVLWRFGDERWPGKDKMRFDVMKEAS
jgi:hypothetical protein